MNKTKNKRVIVAMSGGVDSSVAAKLLKDEGFDPTGIFLHFWKDENNPPSPLYQGGIIENKCCSLEALADARRVCQKIGMSLYTLNFSDVFKKEVVDYFLDEYKHGRTPNPCVRCNKSVKLGLLIKRAKKLGFDYVASGHYARITKTQKHKNPTTLKLRGASIKTKFIYRLFRGKDEDKDQSYFLWTLTQEQLSHLIFPLGNYKKPEVRKLAEKFKLPTASKRESQEICFIPGESHNDFLKKYIKLKPGPIKLLPHPNPLLNDDLTPAPLLDRRGETTKRSDEVIGKHQGLPLYTIGQRKGVEIGGIGPFYVAKCDYKTNTLYVASDGNDPILYSDKLIAEKVNWIAGVEPKLPFVCEAVIRYRHKPTKCKVEKHKNTKTQKHEKQEEYLVKFVEPQRAITAGQSVVFYKKDEVIGGGIISC